MFNDIILGDCLEVMKGIPDGSVDMILADLPYGTTACPWDSVIPLEPLWSEYWRVVKPNGAIVLTAAFPFTGALWASERKRFRYSLVWDKVGTTGFANARRMPLRRHEDVLVFYQKMPTYNPAMEERGRVRAKGGSKRDNGCYGDLRSAPTRNNLYYPTSLVQASNASKKGLIHPTQKPVALFEYLIRTYTNPGEVVLDNVMGSGTTAIAALNTGRQFIGIERDPAYHLLAVERVEAHRLAMAERQEAK